MFFEIEGHLYQPFATLFVQGIYVAKKVCILETTEGTKYSLSEKNYEIPIIEGLVMKHFPEVVIG